MEEHLPILQLCSCIVFLILTLSTATDTIAANQAIRDGDTIVSAGGIFEMGFFSPQNSPNRYLGIWYKKISVKTVVWVANRDTPIPGSPGILKVDGKGTLLILLDGANTVIWSSNSSGYVNDSMIPAAQLLDTGNLVVRGKNSSEMGDVIWQSFDYLGDTLLPGMKLGIDLRTGRDRYLTSWKSAIDPSPGEYTIRVDPRGYPQLLKKRDAVIQSRMKYYGRLNSVYADGYIIDQNEIYYTYELMNTSVVLRMMLTPEGNFDSFAWIERTKSWVLFSTLTRDQCDLYGLCGAYGICNIQNAPICSCLAGFVPKYKSADSSGGCVRAIPLFCSEDGFLKISGLKLPDTSYTQFYESKNLWECEASCQNNCSCLAYGSLHSKGAQRGCLLWFGDLFDATMSPWNGQDLYVRMAASDLLGPPITLDCQSGYNFERYQGKIILYIQPSFSNKSMTLWECRTACKNNCSCTAYGNQDMTEGGSGCLLWSRDLSGVKLYSRAGRDLYIRKASSEIFGQKTQGVAVLTLSTSIGMVLIAVTVWAWRRKKKRSHLKRKGRLGLELQYTNLSQKEDLEVPSFKLSTIVKATNNFSVDNKLGEGGFGPVYKGILEQGQEIAVKQLSKMSRQGLEEFKNEIICIAKVQQRNLVKLIGYCIEEDEMMLIYEYMPNKSLDSFIFDRSKGSSLDWTRRLHIIHGIARGLQYLHEDSRLRIIHRDLKAGNILLDSDMNAKISDFGLARMLEGQQTGANTNKVVGTYGYISPEYAVHGLFSVKSDVFSFGVLVLEIVSGMKNRGFSHQDHQDNLLGHAWRLYKEEKSVELIDSSLQGTCTISEVLRAIHIGLLCVQQCPEDRPTMPSVVLMLGSEVAIPPPKQPGFLIETTYATAETPISVDEATITLLDAR